MGESVECEGRAGEVEGGGGRRAPHVLREGGTEGRDGRR